MPATAIEPGAPPVTMPSTNPAAPATKPTVEAGGRYPPKGGGQQGWIRSGPSHGSARDLVAWSGLGAASQAGRVTLRWPSITVQTLTDVAVDWEILVEGRH